VNADKISRDKHDWTRGRRIQLAEGDCGSLVVGTTSPRTETVKDLYERGVEMVREGQLQARSLTDEGRLISAMLRRPPTLEKKIIINHLM